MSVQDYQIVKERSGVEEDSWSATKVCILHVSKVDHRRLLLQKCSILPHIREKIFDDKIDNSEEQSVSENERELIMLPRLKVHGKNGSVTI